VPSRPCCAGRRRDSGCDQPSSAATTSLAVASADPGGRYPIFLVRDVAPAVRSLRASFPAVDTM
jgi:hypothetical protein